MAIDELLPDSSISATLRVSSALRALEKKEGRKGWVICDKDSTPLLSTFRKGRSTAIRAMFKSSEEWEKAKDEGYYCTRCRVATGPKSLHDEAERSIELGAERKNELPND